MIPRRNLLWMGAGLAIGAGFGILILFGLGYWDELAGRMSAPPASFGVGAPAPDFTLERLDGEQVHLSDLRGSVVLLNFWATWCGPCKEEMPLLQERHERYAPDLQVLAVDFAEPVKEVRAFAEEFRLTFDILLDSRAFVQELYKVRGYPTTYLVDAEGIIRVQHIGIMSEKQLDDYLAQAGFSSQNEPLSAWRYKNSTVRATAPGPLAGVGK